MIGTFRYIDVVPEGDIAVEMFRGVEGAALGLVHFPAWVRTEILKSGERPVDEPLGIAFALGYGVVIAAMTKSDLVLTGDRSVWDPDWGSLAESGADPELVLSGIDRLQ